MSRTLTRAGRMSAVGAVLIFGASFAFSAGAQTAPAPEGTPPAVAPAPAPTPGPSPARQAIEARKAVFTLIGSNFRPLGNVVKGATPYDAADAQKRIARLAFLAELLNDAFPDVSNTGEPDTKTKAEAWTNRADFDKKLKEFQAHLATLGQVNATEKGATEAFKVAFTAVGQDCKGCHDTYKVK